MDRAGAEAAVVTSAIVVGGVWGYRKLVEPIATTGESESQIKALIGAEPTPAPAAQFLVAYGFTFTLLSVVVMISPEVGGGLAILIATGSILANGLALFTDLSEQTSGKTPKAKTTSSTSSKTKASS